MRSSGHSPDIDNIFPFLPFSQREVGPDKVRNLIEPRFGEGGRHIISGSNDIRMMVADFTFRRNVSAPAIGHGFLKFHYKLRGKNVVRFANKPEMLIETGRSAIVYHPEGLSKDDCFPAGAREVSVTIGCRRQVALELLGISSDEMPKAARRFFDCPDTDFCADELPLTAQMVEAVYSLINPKFSPWLRNLHIESKILDLMCLSMHELTKRDFLVDPKTPLKPRDIDTLQAIRQFLQTSISNDITIPSLCRKFATNRAKLSAGFKTLFGETIFEYVHKLRMDHAMALITDTEMAISEVAERVGYSHQSSFSTAFREHHGVPPLNARQARTFQDVRIT